MPESTDESAVVVPDMEGGPTEISEANIAYVERSVHAACHNQSNQTLLRLSLVLGILETPLTFKDPSERRCPGSMMFAGLEAGVGLFYGFVYELDLRIRSSPTLDVRGKVKMVADAVWSHLSGSFSKDILHGQHLSEFIWILRRKVGKKKLDCGGVVTTVLAACALLAAVYGHKDLADACFQVSEDHCWVSLDGSGSRLASAEVTTTSASKRAAPVDEQAWGGWLYSGGSALVCTTLAQHAAALVTSLDPSIVKRQNTGVDSEDVQLLQRRLLEVIQREAPDALYPAAACALADLQEIRTADFVEKAELRNDLAAVSDLLLQETDPTEVLFRGAAAAGDASSASLFYPHSYLFGFLKRKAEVIAEVSTRAGTAGLDERAQSLRAEALSCAGSGCARILRHYRHSTSDEQLVKDVEGVLEDSCALVKGTVVSGQADALRNVFMLWDGICCYFEGRAKPSSWIDQLMKAAKACSVETRQSAADDAEIHSEVMERARPLWAALKPIQLRPLFETANVTTAVASEDRQSSKRVRR